ncbi:hypothetical protein DITRI_Ditri19aG0202900 [Diplodiscus trichospermus]
MAGGIQDVAGTSLDVKDSRKLSAATPDQTLQFFLLENLDRKLMVSPSPDIFDEGLKFGHSNKICPKKHTIKVKIWIPKKKVEDRGEVKKDHVTEKWTEKVSDMEIEDQEAHLDNIIVLDYHSINSVDVGKFKSPKKNLVPLKVFVSFGKVCPVNNFVILNSAIVNEHSEEESKVVEDFRVTPKKPRATSIGAAKLMKSLRNNKKWPIYKGK